ncbi:MAG: DUF4199 domain-containing protein [Rikenellaceae bacterium]|nr:DUF4199 domain-containing protein [Rikenellaceae bacterium]
MSDKKLLRTRAANWGVSLGVVLWVMNLLSWQFRWELEHPMLVNALIIIPLVVVLWWSGYRNVRTEWEEPYGYGRSLGFMLSLSALAGVAWGVGTFVLSAWIAPEYYTELINHQIDQMLLQSGADDALIEMMEQMRGASVQAMRNPFVCILSGVMNLVMYGGLFGIAMAAVLRKKNEECDE